MKFFSKIKIFSNCYYFLILAIIPICYLINYSFFGFLPINPHDTLENEILYNVAIGKLMTGDDSYISLFLNGEHPILLLRRLFHLSNIFYVFLDNIELAFWSTEITKRFLTLIFFFKFSNLIIKEKGVSLVLSAIWSTIIIPDNYAYSFAIYGLPYLIYLLHKDKELKFKNLAIVSLIGLNSHFYYDVYLVIFLIIFKLFFKNNQNWKLFIKISILFFTTCLIANFNFILFILFHFEPLHRQDFIGTINYKDFIFLFIRNLFMGISYPAAHIPKNLINITEEIFPIILNLITLSLLVLGVYKNSKLKKILFFYLIISIYSTLPYLADLLGINNKILILRIYDLERIYPLMLVISLIFIFKLIKPKFFLPVFTLILFFLQFNQSYFLFAKKKFNYNYMENVEKEIFKNKLKNGNFLSAINYSYNISKNNIKASANYRELWSFNGFYQTKNYKFIKKIIKDDTAITFSQKRRLNNMAPILAKIKIADGYYNLYPLKYKERILKIFKNCDEGYQKIKNYGSRIDFGYCDFSKLDLSQMKNIGIKYIISDHKLSNIKNINLVCKNCNGSEINLYLLN